MRKVNITQVKKAITKNGEWSGYLLGNKTNFLYYLHSELGNRVAFYEEE